MVQLGCESCKRLFHYEPDPKTWPPTCPHCGNRQNFVAWAGSKGWETEKANLWENKS